MRVHTAIGRLHTAQHGSIRHASGTEHRVPGGQFIQRVGATEIGNACFLGAFAFVIIAEHEASKHLATDALQGCRCEHAFRGAALANIEIDAGVRVRGGDHASHVTIRDQGNPGANRTQALDDPLMARAAHLTWLLR